MSLLSKIVKGIGSVVKTVAPLAAVIPSPIQPIAAVLAGARAVTSAQPAVLPGAGQVFGQPSLAGVIPGLPALGGIAARGAAMLPAVVGGARVAGAVGGRLLGAAQRWCQRNPKTCASLGGAAIVADMMRSGEIKRPGRRINPLNVKAARRAIRRIKSVRKICNQIERAMPMRRASRFPSPGVITRAEASRALRR